MSTDKPMIEEIRNAQRTRAITTAEVEFLLEEIDRLKAENERLLEFHHDAMQQMAQHRAK